MLRLLQLSPNLLFNLIESCGGDGGDGCSGEAAKTVVVVSLPFVNSHASIVECALQVLGVPNTCL